MAGFGARLHAYRSINRTEVALNPSLVQYNHKASGLNSKEHRATANCNPPTKNGNPPEARF